MTTLLISAVSRAASLCRGKTGAARTLARTRYTLLRKLLQGWMAIEAADLPGRALSAALASLMFSILPLMVAGCL